jgi:hypothetical protein
MGPVSQWGQSMGWAVPASEVGQSVNGVSGGSVGQWGVSQWGVSQRKRVGQPASHGPVANPAVGDYAR